MIGFHYNYIGEFCLWVLIFKSMTRQLGPEVNWIHKGPLLLWHIIAMAESIWILLYWKTLDVWFRVWSGMVIRYSTPTHPVPLERHACTINLCIFYHIALWILLTAPMSFRLRQDCVERSFWLYPPTETNQSAWCFMSTPIVQLRVMYQVTYM